MTSSQALLHRILLGINGTILLISLSIGSWLMAHSSERGTSGADAWSLAFGVAAICGTFSLVGCFGYWLLLREYRLGGGILCLNAVPLIVVAGGHASPMQPICLPFLVGLGMGLRGLFLSVSSGPELTDA